MFILYSHNLTSIRVGRYWNFSWHVGKIQQFPDRTHIHADFGPFTFCHS